MQEKPSLGREDTLAHVTRALELWFYSPVPSLVLHVTQDESLRWQFLNSSNRQGLILSLLHTGGHEK